MAASPRLVAQTPAPSEGTVEALDDRGVWGSGAWRDLGVGSVAGDGTCLIAPVPGEEDPPPTMPENGHPQLRL